MSETTGYRNCGVAKRDSGDDADACIVSASESSVIKTGNKENRMEAAQTIRKGEGADRW